MKVEYKTLATVFAAAILMTACVGKKDGKGIDNGQEVAEQPKELTLMSYNIHNGKGLDKVTDYARIGKMIKSHNPDVVAIQEIDSVTGRSEGIYVLEEIAREAGMECFFAPAIDYDGGKYGIGVLSKESPLTVKRLPLPGREEARAVIAVEYPEYVFACTHLSLTEEDRDASIGILTQLANEYDKPFFIAGDFNSQPGSNFIDIFTKDFTTLTGTTSPTFPADEPTIVIDYIMAKNGAVCEVTEAKVVEEPQMSDHRPVLAKMKLGASDDKE